MFSYLFKSGSNNLLSRFAATHKVSLNLLRLCIYCMGNRFKILLKPVEKWKRIEIDIPAQPTIYYTADDKLIALLINIIRY